MNYSLSTSWNSKKHKSGYDLIKEITAIGFDTVELNFALTEPVVADILSMHAKGAIKVSSLHNMCPLPADIEPAKASPDYYSIASSCEEERKEAIRIAKNTIDNARKFGAPAIVLHAGRVPIKDKTRELAALIGDKSNLANFRTAMISERALNRNGYLDNVIDSLGELVPYAKAQGVGIGIENRYYYREIPIMEELDAILGNFKEGDLYYWHDTGHAEVFDRLGLCSHEELLEKFSSRLIGMHLHDIIGMIDDHRPPGLGTFDFSTIKPYLRTGLIKVLEVHQPATAEEILKGAEYLDRALK